MVEEATGLINPLEELLVGDAVLGVLVKYDWISFSISSSLSANSLSSAFFSASNSSNSFNWDL